MAGYPYGGKPPQSDTFKPLRIFAPKLTAVTSGSGTKRPAIGGPASLPVRERQNFSIRMLVREHPKRFAVCLASQLVCKLSNGELRSPVQAVCRDANGFAMDAPIQNDAAHRIGTDMGSTGNSYSKVLFVSRASIDATPSFMIFRISRDRLLVALAQSRHCEVSPSG